MDRKFKVISLYVGGGSNSKIYHSGDVVTQKNFPDQDVDDLVKKKFLEEIKIEKASEESVAVALKNLTTEKVVKSIDEFSRKQLVKQLFTAKIDFSIEANKEELYQLWLANQ